MTREGGRGTSQKNNSCYVNVNDKPSLEGCWVKGDRGLHKRMSRVV